MKQITMGILAHVDAGKTTLSEGLLYTTGAISKLGRVDNQDAFLDHNDMERNRGITIFSKQAVIPMEAGELILLDTPGHVDFSAEMERTLQVLDYAVLVISGADGVQSHTETLWQLLDCYQIPTFIFVNKMDQPDTDPDKLLQELKEKLGDGCTDFGTDKNEWMESVALCEEELLETYLETGELAKEDVCRLIGNRQVYPVIFGSALKMDQVDTLLQVIWQYSLEYEYPQEFGAKVFKISRDSQGNRLTHLKVTGGEIKPRMEIPELSEKINQIRIYNGEKFRTADQVKAGGICVVTGLEGSKPGMGFGVDSQSEMPILEPVLTYRVCPENGIDVGQALPMLREVEEEIPELHITLDEEHGEIQAWLMGEIQIQIIKHILWERFRLEVSFSAGSIVYKETIAEPTIGIGHFEPLRHYAEVHLLMEPGEPGSGLEFGTVCSEDILDKNWQRLILTHLEERVHRGVLVGAPITDMKISVLAGRAHNKHTEGGDFRQSTYRAIRQGLRSTESILLEPYYHFTLQVPTEMIGRAMTDLERMFAKVSAPETSGEWSILTGEGPVATIRSYHQELAAYTSGLGKMSCQLAGYKPCHNQEEVILEKGYDPDRDLRNTADSVFCAHGSGYVVSWNEVPLHAHVDSGHVLRPESIKEQEEREIQDAISAAMLRRQGYYDDTPIGEEEIHSILGQAYGANRNAKKKWAKTRKRKVITAQAGQKTSRPVAPKEKYLLVDGYNIVFAWEDLNELAKDNIDAARDKLMDVMCNYQAYKGMHLILVFDAYKVKGGIGSMQDYHNIHVVYTKEAETADQYIEKLAHQMGRENDVTVATSDGLEQLIIRGEGCKLISAREFYEEVQEVNRKIERELRQGD